MLSKEEQKLKNATFWGDFKNLMKKHMSSTGRRINWISYPTETKDLYVRLQGDSRCCAVNFDIQSKDDGVREVVWEQMGELKRVLENEMGEDGIWIENHETPDGRTISRIRWEQQGLNYFNEEDVKKMYAFLKEKLRAFDVFYQEYKDILIELLD